MHIYCINPERKPFGKGLNYWKESTKSIARCKTLNGDFSYLLFYSSLLSHVSQELRKKKFKVRIKLY